MNLILVIIFLSFCGYYIGRARVINLSFVAGRSPRAQPVYHGMFVFLCSLFPLIVILSLWGLLNEFFMDKVLFSLLTEEMKNLPNGRINLLVSEIKSLSNDNSYFKSSDPVLLEIASNYSQVYKTANNYINILIIVTTILVLMFAYSRIALDYTARVKIEKILLILFFVASLFAIMTTIGIIFSLIFESMRFFEKIHPLDFFFGFEWSPQIALRDDQVASEGTFGIIPLVVGTLLTTILAMLVAVPFGLMSAIYLSEYASPRLRACVKPSLEILAGIPTVVYGFFAAISVAPLLRSWGHSLGLDVASESALAAGVVMGIMIIPFVSSLSDDVITAVPMSLREGSWGLGATRSETILQVVLPAALPGIVGSILLAVSRAIGETMIVVMAAGLAANLTFNPLDTVSTVTVQIVTLLVGDQEFDSAKTLAAFALGLTLFFLTLCLNIIALSFVKKYREKYD